MWGLGTAASSEDKRYSLSLMDDEPHLQPNGEQGVTRLTEIQELLHRQGRRGELGEVIDVFGHVGQRSSLRQRPDKLHFAGHPHKSIQRIKKLDMETIFEIFGIRGQSSCSEWDQLADGMLP